MADVTIKYNSQTIGEMNDSGAAKLLTAGKKCVSDIEVGYVKSGGGAVNSVNGQTGTVELTAEDVGALSAETLKPAVDLALAQAKASGEFDGAGGKSAYQYAQDGGYTGTEAEFAAKLAEEIPTVDSTLTESGQAADAKAVGDKFDSLSEKIVDISTLTLGVHTDGLVYIFSTACL